MKKITLVKVEHKDGLFTYQAYNQDGGLAYKSAKTQRNYVAITFSQNSKGKLYPLNRFGREELMGKGESKHYWGKNDVYLAEIKQVDVYKEAQNIT